MMTDQINIRYPIKRFPSAVKRFFCMYRQNRCEFFRILRYLFCGAWNTLFGFAVYAGAYAWLGRSVNYIVLIIPVNILAITNAFLCYKFFVFRTRGNGWHEYFRCYLVYGWVMALNAFFLFVFVKGFSLHPVVGNGLCLVITTIISYFGHSRFSFRGHSKRFYELL